MITESTDNQLCWHVWWTAHGVAYLEAAFNDIYEALEYAVEVAKKDEKIVVTIVQN
jgi:hypothetical protein